MQQSDAQPPQDPQEPQDLNPEVVEWLKNHPKPEDTLSLPRDKKREFVSKYYAADDELDEQIEKMLDQAEEIVEKEIEAGKDKYPFSEQLVVGLINIAKVKVLDELIGDVSKLYEKRREQVKGLDITEQKVTMITQQSCTLMAIMLQGKLVKQIEQEVKSRDLPLNQLMQITVGYLMGDLSMFVEVEKFYNLKKVEEHKDRPCDVEKLKKYIQESIKISQLILEDKVNQNSLFLFPHILSDKLFNETGYESEEIVFYIRQLNEKDELDDETLDLIITEAYSVEKSKEKCMETFDNQMKNLETHFKNMEVQAQKQAEIRKQAQESGQGVNPAQDKALLKMMKMGLNVPPELAQGMMGPPPGMFPPGMGMPPAGMFPPGMMPPGMGMPPQQPKAADVKPAEKEEPAKEADAKEGETKAE